MLFKSFTAFQARLDYSKRHDGSWTAEFHGPVDIVARGTTLEACRHRAIDTLDEVVAAWLTGRIEPASNDPARKVSDG